MPEEKIYVVRNTASETYRELYSGCTYSNSVSPAIVERRKAKLDYIAKYMFFLFRTTFKNREKECIQLADRNGLITHCEKPERVGKVVRSTKYSGPEMLDILHKSHYLSLIAYEEIEGKEPELFYGMWYVLRDLSGEPFAIIMVQKSEPCSDDYIKDLYFCCQAVQAFCEYHFSQQNLIDAIPNAVLLTNTQGKIYCVNTAARACADFDLIGKNIDALKDQNIKKPKVDTAPENARILGHKIISDQTIKYVRQCAPTEGRIIVLSTSGSNHALPTPTTEKRDDGCSAIIGNSPSIMSVKHTIKVIAKKPVSVLIQGESGTGKELAARAIHMTSGRKGPFIALNCGAMNHNLLYSELFGYEEGSFTGAARGGKKGKIELSDGGTLFLDEIGEMSLDMQVSLLRVLESRSVMPVGGKSERKVDIRVVAATNRDLQNAVNKGTFRADLYFRLAVIPLHLPPLRQRKEDIPALAEKFAQQIREDYGIDEITITEDAMTELAAYPWYGNVRELRNTLEYMILMSDAEVTLDMVKKTMENVAFHPDQQRTDPQDAEEKYLSSDKDSKREEILKALELCGQNKSKTAKMLGISRKTLYVWLMQYGIDY